MEEIENKKSWLDVFMILVLGLLALTWFRGEYIINIGDFCLPLSRSGFFQSNLFLWDHAVSMGYPAPGQMSFLAPYSSYGYLTELAGISLVIFEKSLFYVWFTLSGLSMYYLCRVLGFNRLTRISAALFYMMNPYSMELPWHLASGMLLPGYSMTPLLLGLFIRSLTSKKTYEYVFLLLLAWVVLGTYAYANPAILVIHWIILFSYLSYHLIVNRKNSAVLKQAFSVTAVLTCLWILLNIFWIAPYLESMFIDSVKPSTSNMGFISDLETFKLNSASLPEALRLGGLWSLHGKWEEALYYAWSDSYSTPLFILLSFLIPILAIFPLINTEKKKIKNVLYFSILLVFGLFMIKGAKPPFASLNIWLYKHIPLLGTAFRSNIQKWGLLTSFAFSVLVGSGISSAFDYLRMNLNKRIAFIFTSFAMASLFLILAYPFWTGELIFQGGGIIPSARTKIPPYYYAFKDWVKEQPEEFRLFSLPLSKNSNTVYSWGKEGYAGADIIKWFSDKPVIYANYGKYYDIPLLIAGEIEKSSNIEFGPLFKLLNVKYILLHRDINWQVIKNHTWWVNHDLGKVEEFINTQKSLKLEKKFGGLEVYKIDEKFFTPYIYATTNYFFIRSGIESLVSLAQTEYLAGKPVIFLSGEENLGSYLLNNGPQLTNSGDKWHLSKKNRGEITESSHREPKIIFKRINPAKYQIDISGAKYPFWLVFSETFNTKWKLYNTAGHEETLKFSPADIKFFFLKPLDVEHRLANGYCNGWYIDPKKEKLNENFSLIIYFLPQSIFYAGALVSAITLVFCLLFFVILKFRAHEK
ncbi:MAG: alpha-(1-_3)-arabinofuranosyltransferase family protein [Candidatus Omnitrophica bacterium]|nr:alpha-(1->3)-arabinofuranosyltransferase family protein [Candidatus Omnitrophota bacterium]